MLNRAVKEYGLQGQGDVGDVLGHLNALAPKSAQAVQDGIFQGTGIRVQPRIAPDGPGFDPESVRPALPKANPWGSADGADPQAAAGMAKVLLTKGDYARGAVPHFKGEFARDSEAARAYTAAVYDEMAKADPQAAALFARQMGDGGLVPIQDPAPAINDLGKRALGGDAEAVRDFAATYTDLLNTDEAAAAKAARNFEQTYGVPIEAAFELGKPASPATGRSYSEAEVLRDWKGNVERQTGMRLTEAADRSDGRKSDAGPIREAHEIKGKERIRNILEDAPGKFVVKDAPEHDGSAPAWRIHRIGYDAVEKHEKTIDRIAKEVGVDADLLRAIAYYENADGHRFGVNDFLDDIGRSKTVMPMNINPEIWGELGMTKENASDPDVNIRAAATLLRRIEERIVDPTPEKVGSVWNGITLDSVNHRGARIGRIYREKPWKSPPKRYPHMDGADREPYGP